MKQSNLQRAIEEAHRFLKIATEQYNTERTEHDCRFDWAVTGSKSSATRRASMDLTRALATLRRSKYSE